MKLETKYIKFEDLQPGMMVQLSSAKGSVHRKIYKTQEFVYPPTQYRPTTRVDRYIWGIVCRFSQSKNDWEEECNMTSNMIEKVTKIWLLENGDWVQYKLVVE